MRVKKTEAEDNNKVEMVIMCCVYWCNGKKIFQKWFLKLLTQVGKRISEWR